MPATATNLTWATDMLDARVGAPYVYGGVLSPTNTRQGCDCSALAAHALNAALFGPAMTWQRVDPTNGNAWITTESWRPIRTGQRGPFGTITVSQPADIPAGAPVKVALHHGPGGGENSHMWIELAGRRFESAGSKGLVTGNRALSIADPYGTDWAYLPAPAGPPPAPPPAPPHTYTVSPGDTLGGIASRYGLDWRQLARINALADPDQLAVGRVLFLAERRWPDDYTDRELLIDIARQLRGPIGEGWAQLGGRSVVDAMGALLPPALPHGTSPPHPEGDI